MSVTRFLFGIFEHFIQYFRLLEKSVQVLIPETLHRTERFVIVQNYTRENFIHKIPVKENNEILIRRTLSRKLCLISITFPRIKSEMNKTDKTH